MKLEPKLLFPSTQTSATDLIGPMTSGKILFFLTFTSFSAMALVQDGQAPPGIPAQALIACHTERIHFCEDAPDLGRLVQCLLRHGESLSSTCKQNLDRFIEARNQTTERNGGVLSAFGGLNAAGQPLRGFSYDTKYNFGGGSSPSLTENKINISTPVYVKGSEVYAISLLTSQTVLGQSVTLSTGAIVPSTLTRVELGAQYFHLLDEKKTLSFRGSLGYDGDQPFNTFNDIVYSLNANYSFPASNGDTWLLMAFIGNLSPLLNNIPIPGFAYVHRTATFTGAFGLPVLTLIWTLEDPWIFSFSAFGPNLQAEIDLGHRDQPQLFLGYGWTRQNYIPSVRSNFLDRLTLEEQHAGLGIRLPIAKPLVLEVQTGPSFGRALYIGKGLGNTEGGSTTINQDWYAAANLKCIL